MKRFLSLLARKDNIQSIPLWIDIIIVMTFIVIFCGIIIPILGSDSTYFDEGYSAYLAHLSIPQAAYYTSLDVHPPLYYVALHGWQLLFGGSISALRMMSVVWASVCIIFAFLLTRRAFGRKAAWIVLPFFTFSPLFIRYSEAARMYTMALAFSLAATYVLVQLYNCRQIKKRRLLWIAYAVLVAAGMWTNYFTALVWLSHAAWITYEYYRIKVKSFWNAEPPKGWIGAIILAIVLYIPWLPFLLSRYSDIQSNGFWIKPISLDTLASTLTTMTVLTPAGETTSWLAVGVIGWVILAVWIVSRAYRQTDSTKKPLFRLIIILSMGPSIFLAFMSLPPLRPAYTYRYALAGVCMTMVLVGVSLALSQFTKHACIKKLIIGTFLIGLLLVGTLNWSHQGNRNLDTGGKSTVAHVFEQIDQSTSQVEPIIIVSPYTYYAASVYETTLHPIYYVFSNYLKNVGVTQGLYDMPNHRGIKSLQTFTKQYKRVWVVGEDKNDMSFKPISSWKTVRSVVINDPNKGTVSSYAIEYRAP